MTALAFLDYASVFIFALTGAFAASRAQLDIVGFVFLASLVGMGGGTIRDLLLDRPPLWITDPTYLGVAAVAAVLVFFLAHLVGSRLRWLVWLDACALSVAVPAGFAVALATGQPWPIVLLMGVVTGTFGGLMRDVVVNDVPVVLVQGELYVTAAAAGGIAGLAALSIGDASFALLICALTTLILRAGSLRFGWCLPTYKSRAPRR
ncbi:TRIC cation channel family protein [Maribius pontilimi]|uniref:TRIC cation channel family protein n=1 Tax=Palleronia pontilimi TaxID=1964209 RepID=A0A934MF69_9RHOB|nr:TRIC cation channel family protein [Palleronia pontilimi]MBJ3764191.1 TRIC cation channel family protein [Palleronia pontilimi]